MAVKRRPAVAARPKAKGKAFVKGKKQAKGKDKHTKRKQHEVRVDDGVDYSSLKTKSGAESVNGVTADDLSLHVDDVDLVAKAKRIYEEHGCVVVRQLNREYVGPIQSHADTIAKHALSLLPKAKVIPEGWLTSDGTLWVPTPKEHQERLGRDKQIMVLGLDYYSSSALVGAATDKKCLDIVEAILGPNIELFGKGQCFYKEPLGGNPKLMHQDAAYFEFENEGVVGTLNYAVDCSTQINNGPLYVVPGTHKVGGYGHHRPGAYQGQKSTFAYIEHVNTRSHLALDPKVWTFDEAIPINGKAGDTIFFHLNCVHGSTPNFSDKPRATFINRYLACGDKQIIFATSAKMRKDAERAYQRGQADRMPKQDAGFVVRGQKLLQGGAHESQAFH